MTVKVAACINRISMCRRSNPSNMRPAAACESREQSAWYFKDTRARLTLSEVERCAETKRRNSNGSFDMVRKITRKSRTARTFMDMRMGGALAFDVLQYEAKHFLRPQGKQEQRADIQATEDPVPSAITATALYTPRGGPLPKSVVPAAAARSEKMKTPNGNDRQAHQEISSPPTASFCVKWRIVDGCEGHRLRGSVAAAESRRALIVVSPRNPNKAQPRRFCLRGVMAQSAAMITDSPNSPHYTLDAHQDAYALIGSYTLGDDFELCLIPSETSGNKFVYKARANYQPLRAVVLGVILDDTTTVTAENETGRRLVLARFARASDKAAIFFYNDVWTLARTMESEDMESTGGSGQLLCQGAVTAKPWCYEDRDEDGNSVIYVDYSGDTRFGIGSNVVVEATFHRRDVYVDGKLHRSYTIAAHEIEVVATKDIELAGLVDAEVAPEEL
ncbi:hypothetical protein DFH06DRAFT_1128130 [Mycena polygramma]|nr:hypothetical protein DFH06DRAFT_1128130 [Mycena polygramma]